MGISQSSSKILPQNKGQKPKFIIGIIDVQNDFCKNGALAVDDADDVVAPINKLRFAFHDSIPTFVSQDFHPLDHMSFCTNHGKNKLDKITYKTTINGDNIEFEQTLWPIHCVHGTHGADFHKDLIITENDIHIYKGEYSNIESYSVFGDAFQNKYERTQLHDILQQKHITDIVLVGIATDYCVYYTALDAIRMGYKVHLIMSCTRGVAKGTTDDAIADMRNKHVRIYDTVEDFIRYYQDL